MRIQPRSAALALAMAGLLAAAPTGASAAPARGTMFLNSADSGRFEDGRLTLRGPGIGRVTWFHHNGRSGDIPVARMHRGLFAPQTPTAALDIYARGADAELDLTLSRPRFHPSRHAVSYRVLDVDTPAGQRPAARASQTALPRRFGDASLSMIGPYSRRGTDEFNCKVEVQNRLPFGLQMVAWSKWDTDRWAPSFDFGPSARPGGTLSWTTVAGVFRGCSNTVVLQVTGLPSGARADTFAITTTKPLTGPGTFTCAPSSPYVRCTLVEGGLFVPAVWRIES